MTDIVLAMQVLTLLMLIILEYRGYRQMKDLWIKYAVVQEEIKKMDKQLLTAGRILQVIGDETKIVERRKQQREIQQRFTRTPR
jgi:hypothetical protein